MINVTKKALPATIYLVGFFLIAANLRAPITSIGPLSSNIQQYFNISPSLIGLLNAVPLLVFGICSPLAILGKRIGIEKMLLFAMIALLIGILIRSQGSLSMLFVGYIILAMGIAIGNVLLPSLVKRDFPEYISQMSTGYSLTFGLTAAIASGIAIPLAMILPGAWKSSLAVWGILTAITIFVWLPTALKSRKESPTPIISEKHSEKPVWHSMVAWQVTGFMGLQSLTFYVSISWFPTYLKSHDVSLSTSGWFLSLFQIISLCAGVLIPFIIKMTKDQKAIVVFASLASLTGTLGIFLLPKLSILWFAIAGIGSGISIILALMFISLRSNNHHQATQLSIMAQSIGYLIAASGPFFFGLLFDLFNTWSISFSVFLGLICLQTILGYMAGRNKVI